MSDVSIQVRGLSKLYRIGEVEKYPTIRAALVRAASIPLRAIKSWRAAGANGDCAPTFWALRDVDLEVKEGDVVGIIGRNGAGKSTLLKILSGITEPTKGHADIYGRVGSLLEVGTGFHMELTGRENIFMNGALLGMTRHEIKAKFDEIVAFAETEKFLDTPVKHYSTGMYMRLAFAVAAHLEPEILIVDEVLAVGDVEFQQKCLGKMQDLSKNSGRTVLFVSHNMDAIQRLCTKSALLENGRIVAFGDTAPVIGRYLSRNRCEIRPAEWMDVSDVQRRGTGEARFASVRYSSNEMAVGYHAFSNGPLEFSLAIAAKTDMTVKSLAVTLYNSSGTKLVNADTISLGHVITLAKGRNLVRLRIKQLYLNPGVYILGLWLANPIDANTGGAPFDYIDSAFEIEVVSLKSGEFGCAAGDDGAVTCRFEIGQECSSKEIETRDTLYVR
jgi:lipopolysaccharide transport system ATP-binding protein